MPQEQNVTVNLTLLSPDDTPTTFCKNTISRPNKPITTTFTIIPEHIGNWKLEVTVQSNDALHQLNGTLLVKPEGVLQFFSQPVLIDLHKSKTFDTVIQLPADPADKVAGSEKVSVHVAGDLLGVPTHKLDQLIRLPYEGGEPNMAILATSAAILKYGQTTNKISPQQEVNLVSKTQLGFQRALTYLHSDGSFSLWGKSDRNGSTWFTAYVARVFAETLGLLPKSSRRVLGKAIQFLIGRQNDDGSFRESGKVVDNYVEGGAYKHCTLTAFTTLSLIEYTKVGKADDAMMLNASTAIQKAVTFLESQLESLKDDPYALAITAYALARANSSKSEDALAGLENLMVQHASTVHWKTLESVDDEDGGPGYSYSTHAREVEATAYALLAYMANGNWSMPLKIAAWLISKQNAQGGFFPPTDTAIALAALAQFAQSFTAAPSMQIAVTDGNQKRDMTIFQKSSIDVQFFEFAPKPRDIAINARGSGMAVAYVSWTYNVLQPMEGWVFDLNATLSHAGFPKAKHLTICARHWKEGSSSMTVVEVTGLSGYQFDEV
ncbi:CD109 antigen-like [Paramacrobiotus metropolitanus]|uniref:CD109 antigen-like n=1 Tax=Paramacrobiotus metropolitanus TaxID=2943436 RepID=UPI002445D66E|nr:CD109 antigen-like [Paramacrobiotus metropolitanus]